MRKTFTVLFLLITCAAWSQGVAISQSNLSNCSCNGLYDLVGTDATGRNIYERATTEIPYVNKIRIIFNAGENRWRIELQIIYGGWVSAGTNTNLTTPAPPATGWVPNEYYNSTVPTTTVIYEPATKTASCDGCNWSESTSWVPAGGPPRPYDHAIIDGDVILDTDRTVNNLTINPGGLLTQSSDRTLDVYGDLALNGQLDVFRLLLRKGTSLNGTGLKVKQLRALGTQRVVLTGDVSVYDEADPGNGQYSVTGLFKLGNYNLTTFGGPTDTGVEKSNVNAQTDGSGRIRYYFNAGDTYSRGFNFDGYSLIVSGVGNNGSDKPYLLSAKASPTFTHPLPSDIHAIPCQWDISAELIDKTLEHYFNIIFQWPLSATPVDFIKSNAYVKRWNGVDWENKAGPVDVSSGAAYVSNITDFSSWAIFDSEVVLPVRMVSFAARAEQNTANLEWVTSEEINSDHFEVEHSFQGQNWVKVGQVAARGESQVRAHYTYAHSLNDPGIHYFRIKSVDRDDSFAYSVIRSVRIGTLPISYLYPNPVADRLRVGGNGDIRNAVLINSSGSSLGEFKADAGRAFDVGKLIPGWYVLQFEDEKGFTQKLPFMKR
nr:T9SS type A sorting domain-containing protein [uncultured Dyadobacter sp.]